MNQFQTKLYNDLMTLCLEEGQEAFYFVDQVRNGKNYRIFLYRMASYTEFMKPGALECRGHTFRVDADGTPMSLASMPPQKFFNLGENPDVMGLDLSNIVEVMDKLDGSLISTVSSNDGMFFLKSKGSLNSTQAQDATKLLNAPEYAELMAFCESSTIRDCTVSMEYMAPDNMIVVGYAEPTLKVLNVRDNSTGSYIARDDYKLSERYRVAVHPIPLNGDSWVQEVYKTQDDIEGFVVRMACGTWFKLKTEKYVSLHGLVSNLNSPRRVYELVVNESTDDVMPLIRNNQYLVDLLESETKRVRSILNHCETTVEQFYTTNKHLDRKSYAILGQTELPQHLFGLVMCLYLEKDVDMKEFMLKKYDMFKLTEEPEESPALVE